MKAKDIIWLFFAVFAFLFLFLFLDEIEKARRKDQIIEKLTKENEQLKQGYLSLLEKFLKFEAKVEPEIVTELTKLKEQVDHMDSEMHVELDFIIQMVNEGKGSKAVRDLAKIVENQLKSKIENDKTYKGQKMLKNLLEHAKNCKWISNRQYENCLLLRDVRNSESHENAPFLETREIGLSIFAGIDILYTLN